MKKILKKILDSFFKFILFWSLLFVSLPITETVYSSFFNQKIYNQQTFSFLKNHVVLTKEVNKNFFSVEEHNIVKYLGAYLFNTKYFLENNCEFSFIKQKDSSSFFSPQKISESIIFNKPWRLIDNQFINEEEGKNFYIDFKESESEIEFHVKNDGNFDNYFFVELPKNVKIEIENRIYSNNFIPKNAKNLKIFFPKNNLYISEINGDLIIKNNILGISGKEINFKLTIEPLELIDENLNSYDIKNFLTEEKNKRCFFKKHEFSSKEIDKDFFIYNISSIKNNGNFLIVKNEKNVYFFEKDSKYEILEKQDSLFKSVRIFEKKPLKVEKDYSLSKKILIPIYLVLFHFLFPLLMKTKCFSLSVFILVSIYFLFMKILSKKTDPIQERLKYKILTHGFELAVDRNFFNVIKIVRKFIFQNFKDVLILIIYFFLYIPLVPSFHRYFLAPIYKNLNYIVLGYNIIQNNFLVNFVICFIDLVVTLIFKKIHKKKIDFSDFVQSGLILIFSYNSPIVSLFFFATFSMFQN